MFKFLVVVILFFSQSVFSDQIFIRSFDLGGSGLKTAVFTYDTDLKQMILIEPQTQLGICPDDMEVKDWIRVRIKETLQKELEEEIRLGYVFGFSLAGFDKLRSAPLPTNDLSILCNLPKDKVICIDDGASHLIASLHALKDKLPEGPIWNIGIGTGVSLGYADTGPRVRKLYELYKMFGVAPWDTKEPDSGQVGWRVCSAKSFDRILTEKNGDKDEAFSEFAARWKSYLEANFLNTKEVMPAAIVFTGGHIDTHGDQLLKALSKLNITVPLFTGVRASGLFGAAWHAALYEHSQDAWLECIRSSDVEALLIHLKEGIDVNRFNALGDSALSLAIETNKPELVQILIEYGAFVNLSNFSRANPLSLAVQKGNIATVRLLLDRGVRINAHDCRGRTALFFAQERGNSEMKELLLSKGATL